MQISLMRHYKVDKVFDKTYNSQTFDEASIDYNHCQILDQSPPPRPKGKLYASTMVRAQKTAELAFHETPDILEGIYEVTMRSAWDSDKELPRWIWEGIARFQWRMNHPRQRETYDDTMKRLKDALDQLEERGEDAVLVMHGLVMRYMSALLRKRGFNGPVIVHAKNGSLYTFRK